MDTSLQESNQLLLHSARSLSVIWIGNTTDILFNSHFSIFNTVTNLYNKQDPDNQGQYLLFYIRDAHCFPWRTSSQLQPCKRNTWKMMKTLMHVIDDRLFFWYIITKPTNSMWYVELRETIKRATISMSVHQKAFTRRILSFCEITMLWIDIRQLCIMGNDDSEVEMKVVYDDFQLCFSFHLDSKRGLNL